MKSNDPYSIYPSPTAHSRQHVVIIIIYYTTLELGYYITNSIGSKKSPDI